MPTKATALKDPAIDPAEDDSSTLGDKLSDTASKVKDKVSEMGQTAADKINDNRDVAAEGLEKAAMALHENAEGLPGGEKVSDLAHVTAEKLNSTAEYVREHDVKSMMTDVESLVRKNPGPALLAAVAVGFLIGRAFSSSD
jgi:ElaB/YqjD/DUF883 family membrane-anchored ribosome-binding protein